MNTDLIRDLHAQLTMLVSQMVPTHQELMQLRAGLTPHAEFLHPRYAIELWRANKAWSAQPGLNDEQRRQIEASAASYPFLSRAHELDNRPDFDGNKSPHRAFAMLLLGVQNGNDRYKVHKGNKVLEHLVDFCDGVENVGASFSCPLSICLVPRDLRPYSDRSPIARFLFRARAVHLLQRCWNEMADSSPDLAKADCSKLFMAWSGCFPNHFGSWEALVTDDTAWGAIEPYSEPRLAGLLKDRAGWPAYTRFLMAKGIPVPAIPSLLGAQ
ncbi:hypothetical protein GC173_14765 [bacterium]|nr:hypothetical protein [bacterium]